MTTEWREIWRIVGLFAPAQAAYCLRDGSARKTITESARRMMLAEHTYAQRMATLVAIMQ
jgi:spore maturation protein CgeB